MKKVVLILSLVLGLTAGTYAQSLFNRDGNDQEEMRGDRGGFPGIPGHGEDDNQDAPLGGGALLLIGFGAAYAMSKKNKN